MEEKTLAASLKEKLMPKTENGWNRITHAQQEEVMEFAKGYMDFLARAKTERETVEAAVEILQAGGFLPFSAHGTYQPGDRVYLSGLQSDPGTGCAGKCDPAADLPGCSGVGAEGDRHGGAGTGGHGRPCPPQTR